MPPFIIFTLDANVFISVAVSLRKIHTKTARILQGVSLLNQLSCNLSTAITNAFADTFAARLRLNHSGWTGREATFHAMLATLVANWLLILVQTARIVAIERRYNRYTRIVARALRGSVSNLTRTLDWAKFLTSPSDRRSGCGAFMGENGNGGTKAFAVAAEVAGARVVDATLDERLGIHETTTRAEKRSAHHTALLFGPDSNFVIGALGRLVGCRCFAFRVDGPLFGEYMRGSDRPSAISREKIITGDTIEIAAETLHFVRVIAV